MLKDIFDFIDRKGLLSPTILAAALLGVVYFQRGVDADQRENIDDLYVKIGQIARSLEETSRNNAIATEQLRAIDERGTKSERELRREMEFRTSKEKS